MTFRCEHVTVKTNSIINRLTVLGLKKVNDIKGIQSCVYEKTTVHRSITRFIHNSHTGLVLVVLILRAETYIGILET